MNGDYSIFNNSMNGVITLSDGISFITDGQAQHENVIYTNFIKSEDELTILTHDSLTTIDISANNLDVTNISADSETLGTLTVTNLNVDNYGFYVDGFANTISSSLPYTMNNSLKVVGNEFTLENGNITQIGTTSINTLKTTTINGSLTCQSDLIQTGGNAVLKNITCDNVTMNSNKSISQSGSGIANSFGTSTISNLVVTTSMTFPAAVTIPDAEQTGDLTFTGGARIIQNLTEAGTNFNTFMYSKIAKVDVNGDITQTSGVTTLQNTTIEGTAQIQGDITQTAGQAVFKAIGCDQLSLTANKDIFFTNGTGRIDQSVASGTNLLNTITMNANRNITLSGTGIFSQSGTGTNALKNTSITGTLAVSSTATLTGNVDIGGSLTLSANKSITQPTGTTNNQFQNTTISNLSCPTANITNLTATTLSVGNVSNAEIQYLDGVTAPIQAQIDNINSTTIGNATALTGFTYIAGTDTTNIDNNVVIPTPKTLSVGSIANVETNLQTLNTNVPIIDASLNSLTNTFNTTTSGITYTAGTDTTTIDNNVTINKNLVVQGMNIKAEIDALETSFTTGTITSTNATVGELNATNVTVSNLVQSYFFRSRDTSDATKNFLLYQGGDVTNYDHRVWGGEARFVNYDASGNQVVGIALNSSSATLAVPLTATSITASSNITASSVTATSATINNLTINSTLNSDGLKLASNTIVPTFLSPSFGTTEVPVATFTLTAYTKGISITSPISMFRQYRNFNSGPTLFNIIRDTVNSVSYTIKRNGTTFATGVCGYNNTLPNNQITVQSTSSTTSRSYEVYITNATCSFTPAFSLSTDVYTVLYTISFTKDLSWQSFNFIEEQYHYVVNTDEEGSTDTLNTGSAGSNYQVEEYTTSIVYLAPNNTSVNINQLVCSSIYNQSLVTNTIDSTGSIKLNASIHTDENRVVQSPATYFGVWMIDHALDDSYLLNSFQPVPSSVAVAGTRDDAWIVAAGYVVVLYRYASYSIVPGARPWAGTTDNESQTRVLNNQNGTTFLCFASTDIYGAANQVGSVRVFYRGVEVTIPWLTYPPSTPPESVPPYVPFWAT